MSYPKNNATPPMIAVGEVHLIADGSLVTADALARVITAGGAWGAKAGTLACDTTSGCWTYAPTQAETNGEWFIVAVYKASCTGCQVTVITGASATAGRTMPADGSITAAVIADAAIDNATLAADVGSTAYATNIIALAVRKVLDELNLDHLAKVADSDDVVNDSIIGKLAATDGDWSNFAKATDSLQSIRDKLPTNLEDLSVTDTTGLVKTADDQKVDVNTIKTKAVTVDAGGTTFPASIHASGAAVSLSNGAITDASLAGNMEIVFETDFATNYNTTRNAWATNVQDFVGTTGADPFAGKVVAASVTANVNAVLANAAHGGAAASLNLAGGTALGNTTIGTLTQTGAVSWGATTFASIASSGAVVLNSLAVTTTTTLTGIVTATAANDIRGVKVGGFLANAITEGAAGRIAAAITLWGDVATPVATAAMYGLTAADTGATYVARAPSGTETLDSLAADIAAVSTAVVTGVPQTILATAQFYVTDASANRVNTFAATYLSNGTAWTTAPTTPAVAESGSTLSPFGLNVNLLYTAATGQTINSVSIRGNFAAGAGRYTNVYAYNSTASPRVWDMLSDSGTRMNTTATLTSYTYSLLSTHQKATAAVTTTADGNLFSAAGTTCTANFGAVAHGFVTGDIVTITGNGVANFNGVVMVTRVDNFIFTYLIPTTTATGSGTATMVTDAIGTVRIGFKSPSVTLADRLNIDQCIVNVATANPSTADIAAAVKAAMVTTLYTDGIWIDTTGGGAAGQVAGTNGTRSNPSSTYADAIAICATLGIRALRLKEGSSIILTQSHAAWNIYGGTVALGGQAIGGADFESCTISGVGTGDDVSFKDCTIGTCTLGAARFKHSGFDGTVTLVAGKKYSVIRCYDNDPSTATQPVFIFAGTNNLGLRDWTGGVEIGNFAANDYATLDGAGRLVIGSTCSANPNGIITIRGMWATTTDNVVGNFKGTLTEVQRYGTDLINAQVDLALNTAIPGSPTADSINERVAQLDTDVTYIKSGWETVP